MPEFMHLVEIDGHVGHYMGFDNQIKKHVAIADWCSPRNMANAPRDRYFGEIIMGVEVTDAKPKKISKEEASMLSKLMLSRPVEIE